MKTIRNILFFIFVFCTARGAAQNIDFNKLEKIEGISSIYISSAMLRMAPDVDVKAQGIDLGNLVGKLESVLILNSDKAETSKQLKTAMSELAKDKNYEELMRMKENGEQVNIYIRKEKNYITELVMMTENEIEFNVIRVTGKLDMGDIQKIKSISK